MPEGLSFLNSLDMFTIKLGLTRVKKLAQVLGNPQEKFHVVHIAGTNGKGSTAAMITSILEQAGFKVGLYTSPHLNRFNERIKINGKNISNKDLEKQINLVRKIADKNKLEPTYFEFTTALAFNYFAEKKIEFAVLETGMGGRLDATNIINPLVSVITTINFEHQQHLGDTLEKIANEKFGIVKEKTMVVSGIEQLELQVKLKKLCRQKNCGLILTPGRYTTELKKAALNKSTFNLFYDNSTLSDLALPLAGEHQLKNAALAIAAVHALRQQSVKVSDMHIRQGLKKTVWPARFEIMQRKPLVVLDAAHNPACFRELQKTLLDLLPDKNIVMVFGLSPDKQLEMLAPLIFPLAKKLYIAESKYKPCPRKKLS